MANSRMMLFGSKHAPKIIWSVVAILLLIFTMEGIYSKPSPPRRHMSVCAQEQCSGQQNIYH